MGLTAAMVVLLLIPAIAGGDVLVNAAEPRTVACGKSVTLGVWYQSFSPGPRWACMTIKSSRGLVVCHKNVTATTSWRYWHYTRKCAGGVQHCRRHGKISVPRQGRLSPHAPFHHGQPNAYWSASVRTPASAIGRTRWCRQRSDRDGHGPPWRPFHGGPKRRAGFQGHGPARGRDRFDVVRLLSYPPTPPPWSGRKIESG